MAREDDIKTILAADATLTGILTGGIYTSGMVGAERINRANPNTSAAFDANGYLKPCLLLVEGDVVTIAEIVDYDEQITSSRQMVRGWYYQEQGSYAAIEAARARVYALLQGITMADSFELRLAQTLTRENDEGALSGASMERQDWQVDFILEPA